MIEIKPPAQNTYIVGTNGVDKRGDQTPEPGDHNRFSFIRETDMVLKITSPASSAGNKKQQLKTNDSSGTLAPR